MIEPIIDSFTIKDITDEEYFGIDYISNSRLSLINPEQDGSEEKYLNKEHSFSSSLSLGSAVHELILEEDKFMLAPKCSKPTAKMGLMADYLFPFYQLNKEVTDEQIIKASDEIGYYKDKMDKKKMENVRDKCTKYWTYRCVYDLTPGKEPIFLDDYSHGKCVACVKSLKDNSEIQSLLKPENNFSKIDVRNECAFFIDFLYKEDDKECILKFKAKLDNFVIDDNNLILNDLKTTGHYVDQFKDSWEKYHYYRQGAIYSYLLKLYAQKYHNVKEINSLTCNFLLVSTIPDHKSSIFKMSSFDLERGWNEFIKLMNMAGHVHLRTT